MDTLTLFTVLMALATVAMALISALNVYYSARHQWLSGMPRLMVGALWDQGKVTAALYNFAPMKLVVFKLAVAKAPSCKEPFEAIGTYVETFELPAGSGQHVSFDANAHVATNDRLYLIVEMAYPGTPGVWSQCFYEMDQEAPGAYRVRRPIPAFCQGDVSDLWYRLRCYYRGFWWIVRSAARGLVSQLCSCGCGKKEKTNEE